jgi:hypothetical protein
MWCFSMYLFCLKYPFKGIESLYSFSQGLGVTKDSAVSLRPLNLLPQSLWHCRICFRGSHWDRASASEVSLRTTHCILTQCAGENKRLFIYLFIYNTESASAVSLKPPNLPYWNRGSGFHGLIETAEANNFKRLSRISRRFRSHMRNGYSPWIRALGGVDWWKKNRGSKISWHCPFK